MGETSSESHPPLRQPTSRQSYLLPFRGSAHPTGEDEATYNGMFFTKKDLEEHARRAVGTPIWYEHDGAKKIGWVTRGFVDARGRLMIDGVIDRRVPGSARAIRELRAGTLKGLSLGLEHLVNDYGPKGKRVVAHIMEEVSLTADPDLPDTDIAEVADDPEMWKLMNRYIDIGIETRKTKIALNKKSEQLLDLLNEASTRTPSSDFTLPDTNKVGQDTEVWKEEAQVCTAVANSGFTSEPAPPEPAHLSTAPAMTTPDQAPTGTTPKDDMSETSAMMAKIVALEKELAENKAQLDQNKSVFEESGTDPDTAKRVLEQHRLREAALRKKYHAEKEDLKQLVIADYVAAGINPEENPELLDALDNGYKNPGAFQPLRDYVATAAGAAAKARLTEVEGQFQQERKEKLELQQRFDEATAAQQKMEEQFQQQGRFEQRAAAYGAAVSGAPVAAVGRDTTRGQKRARVDEPNDAASKADDDSGVMFFGVGGRFSDKNAYLAPVRNPLMGADDELSNALLGIFERAGRHTGMGKVDMRGIVGKQYGKLIQGLTPGGEIDTNAQELRAQAPPTEIPQTGFSQ